MFTFFIKKFKTTKCCPVTKKMGVGLLASGLSLLVSFGTHAAPVQYPLFIANPVKPIMMLNMSKDHQLFYKLYDDYSDIIDMRTQIANTTSSSSSSSQGAITNPNYGKSGSDGVADKTYAHQFRYYGYFDSDKCYTYSNNLFTPSRFVDNTSRYCNYGGVTNEWSGNFLNWSSMTRLDAVRKILYGGKRAVDTEEDTVLERSFLPEDAHAFAKYYNGTDISQLTPFATATGGVDAETSGITICNATSPASRKKISQDVSSDSSIHPLLKVAKGNFSLWGSNEGFQCRWDNGTNDNNAASTGIKAYPSSPKFDTDKLGDGDYSVRVKVCVSGLMNETNEEGCKRYDSGHSKPIGLLQEYGEKDTIHFGLLTGSYGKNKSGGALRKNVGTMKDEIDLRTGQFINPYKNTSNHSLGRKDSIIRTLNALTIYGYDYENGQYNSSDSCPWGLNTFDNGKCTNWGNPQSEIYLESLRYLSGQDAPIFTVDDSSKVSGFSTADWTKPVSDKNYCAPLNVLQFNASTSSYDVDELDKASEVGINNLDSLLNNIGTAESISGNYFVGVSGSGTGQKDQLCTPKTITNLSDVRGTCPDAPRLDGGYQIAGLAHGARKNGIQIKGLGTTVNGKAIDNTPSVHTYAVALAPAVPKVDIPVPGSANKRITILPACRNGKINANCAIVDFKIVEQNHVGNSFTGSMYVDWEDSEQGGDYDQDMWGLIKYTVTSNNVKVETRVFAQATDHALGFGYVIGGTADDGFKVQSGINNFTYGTFCTSTAGSKCHCNDNWKGACNSSEAVWRAQDFAITNSSAANVKLLEQPLYYAAKWGGYANDNATTADILASGAPTYYYATDPRQLAESLRNAFNSIAEREGSSSGVATNSTSLNGSSYLYQAVFNSDNWRGSLDAFAFDAEGRLVRRLDAKGNLIPAVSTDNVQPTYGSRNIYTYKPGSGTINFTWSSLLSSQKDHFVSSTDPVGNYTNAEKRFNWIKGDSSNEVSPTSAGVDRLRSRGTGTSRNVYGDIVNSTPVYIADTNYRYHKLAAGGSSYAAYLATKATRTPKVAVGANDGMLHVFNARTLQEIYSYVPNLVFPKLRNLSAQNYGRSTLNPHQYLVDGPLVVSDVYDGSNWKTIVVGTLGGGGRGVFALDVTNDNNPRVLFEISDTDFPQLGYVLGRPIIAPMQNGRWAVVFGNGDSSGRLANSGTGVAAVAAESHLFIVDIFDPIGRTEVISPGKGKGLSAPAILPDERGVVKTVYAGDLNGQLWKFDLSSSSESNWRNAYSLLFHAKTANSTPLEQPITAAPTLGVNSSKGGKVAVYFGTGKYFEEDDHKISNSNPYHSFYAITDVGTTVTRSQLAKKELEFYTVNGKRSRRLLATTVDWTTKNGWYLEFAQANEERVITKPLLIADKLVFATIIPSASQCDYGGTSWVLEIPAVGDKFTNYNVLKDPPEEGTMTLAPVGMGVTEEALTLLIGRSDGNPDDKAGNQPDKSTGRQSWRELD